MIAAIYARKSTEQAVADDQKSVVRQVAHAREYAQRKGWTVDEAHVFVDDGISGAEFANRPGFVRLMASLKPRPPFQVLIMSEESRLGREAIETAYALKQLLVAGVRVFFYLEDRERTLDSPTDKILLSLTAYADELEREKARQRVTDAMVRHAKAGHVTGGRCFGYENVDVYGPNSERSHVEQRINEAEAAVVRRVFELAADGLGQCHIAKRLNAEGAPAPRAQQGRPRAWVQSSVHAVLFRARYRGEIVWNQTRKRDQWGQVRVKDRPPAEWLRVPAPHLRIVPEPLWHAAHAKISAARDKTYVKATPIRASKYLLPGLARCAWCNGGMHVRTRRRGGGERLALYACTSHYNRGEAVCRNHLQFSMDAIDHAVIRRIDYTLTPDLVDEIIARVREEVDPEHERAARRRIEQQIAALDQETENLAEAIAIGGDVPALAARMKKTHQRRQELADQLKAAEAHSPAPRVNWALVERRARQRLADWRGLLSRQMDQARPVLRGLLDGPIMFTPILEEARRGYAFAGGLHTGAFLFGIVEGNESDFAWRPRTDLNRRPRA